MILNNYDDKRQIELTVTYADNIVTLTEYGFTFFVPDDMAETYGEDPYRCYISAANLDDAVDYFNQTHGGNGFKVTSIMLVDGSFPTFMDDEIFFSYDFK